ncbi:hypothetical protein Tco_0407784 [Tanacetum coccineum]
MSDSEHSTITYLSELDYSDIGSPGINGPPSPDYVPSPEEPEQAPPSPDYVPGPEEPDQAPPSPVYIFMPYVPEPVYPEYILPEDDVFLAEEQPLPAANSPTADLPGYIPETDPEDEPEEDDEDPEEDPIDYFVEGGDYDDDEIEPSEDDDDEEEEHPASANSILPPPALRSMAMISIRPQPPTLSFTKEDAERFLAMPIPPPSPLTPLSSPLPQIPSPPLPTSPTYPLGYRAAMIRLRDETPFTSHSPPPTIPIHTEVPGEPAIPREDPYVIARDGPYGFVDRVDIAPGRPGCPISRELDYGITDEWDDLETTIMYGIMEDALDDWSQLRARVNLLFRDRPIHRRLAGMVEMEAQMAREAWGQSMDASDSARSDVRSLRTTIAGQGALISALQSADHKRQAQLTQALMLLKGLQTQMIEFQRQQGPAKGPAQPDAPGEASSSS